MFFQPLKAGISKAIIALWTGQVKANVKISIKISIWSSFSEHDGKEGVNLMDMSSAKAKQFALTEGYNSSFAGSVWNLLRTGYSQTYRISYVKNKWSQIPW